jgi:hypothetical protein
MVALLLHGLDGGEVEPEPWVGGREHLDLADPAVGPDDDEQDDTPGRRPRRVAPFETRVDGITTGGTDAGVVQNLSCPVPRLDAPEKGSDLRPLRPGGCATSAAPPGPSPSSLESGG